MCAAHGAAVSGPLSPVRGGEGWGEGGGASDRVRRVALASDKPDPQRSEPASGAEGRIVRAGTVRSGAPLRSFVAPLRPRLVGGGVGRRPCRLGRRERLAAAYFTPIFQTFHSPPRLERK